MPRFEVSNAPRYVPRVSTRFICRRCRQRMIELTPILRRGMAAEYFRKTGKLPQVRVTCPAGHKDGFLDVTSPEARRQV